MESTDNKHDIEITDTNQKVSNEKEMSCLAKLGIFVLVVAVISAIIGWIVLKIRGWRFWYETVKQAEEGTFIGDHTTLYILLCAIGFIISIVIVIKALNK